MAKYNYVLQLQMREPAELGKMIRNIESQFSGINANVKINVRSEGVSSAVKQVKQLKEATEEANNVAESLAKTFAVSFKRFVTFSLATRAVGAFTAGLSDSFTQVVDFEKQMVRVSQVTGKSIEGLRGLNKEIVRLSTGLGVSSKTLLDVSLTLAQAGFSANDTKVALESLAKTELAPTFTSIEKTTEGAIALFNQFGAGAEALEEQLGAINKVSADFAVESDDLIDVVRRVGGVFKSSGGSLNELLAIFTSVRATTRESAESIGTALKTIFVRIQRPQTLAYLKQLGVDLETAEGKFVGPLKAVELLNKAFGNLEQGDPKFIQIAEELGGYRQIGKVIPLLQQYEVAQKALISAQKGKNSLDSDAAKAQESLANKIMKVKEEFAALARAIYESPIFQVMAQSSILFASALVKVATALKDIIPLLGVFAAFKIAKSSGAFLGSFGRKLKDPEGFATGGYIDGVGNKDSEHIVAMPGEFVVRKSIVKKHGLGAFNQLNAGGTPDMIKGLPHYADGGLVIRPQDKKVGVLGLSSAQQSGTKTLPNTYNTSKLVSDGGNPPGLKRVAIEAGSNFEYFSPNPDERNTTTDLYELITKEVERGVLETTVNASKALIDQFSAEPAISLRNLRKNTKPSEEAVKSLRGYMFESVASSITGVDAEGGNKPFDFDFTSGGQKSIGRDKLSQLFGEPDINNLDLAEFKPDASYFKAVLEKSGNYIANHFKNGISKTNIPSNRVGPFTFKYDDKGNYKDETKAGDNEKIFSGTLKARVGKNDEAYKQKLMSLDKGIGASQANAILGYLRDPSKKEDDNKRLREGLGILLKSSRVSIKDTSRDSIRKLFEDSPHLSTGGHMGEAISKSGYVPGIPMGDRHPAMLEGNEYVLSSDTVNRVGIGTLNRLNRGGSADVLNGVRHFSKGGLGSGQKVSAGSGSVGVAGLDDLGNQAIRVASAFSGVSIAMTLVSDQIVNIFGKESATGKAVQAVVSNLTLFGGIVAASSVGLKKLNKFNEDRKESSVAKSKADFNNLPISEKLRIRSEQATDSGKKSRILDRAREANDQERSLRLTGPLKEGQSFDPQDILDQEQIKDQTNKANRRSAKANALKDSAKRKRDRIDAFEKQTKGKTLTESQSEQLSYAKQLAEQYESKALELESEAEGFTNKADKIRFKEPKGRLGKLAGKIGGYAKGLGISKGGAFGAIASAVGAGVQSNVDFTKEKGTLDFAAGNYDAGISKFASVGVSDNANYVNQSTAASALTYGGIGAGIGSIVPGLGTGVGASVGAGVGAIVGFSKALQDTSKELYTMKDSIRDAATNNSKQDAEKLKSNTISSETFLQRYDRNSQAGYKSIGLSTLKDKAESNYINESGYLGYAGSFLGRSRSIEARFGGEGESGVQAEALKVLSKQKSEDGKTTALNEQLSKNSTFISARVDSLQQVSDSKKLSSTKVSELAGKEQDKINEAIKEQSSIVAILKAQGEDKNKVVLEELETSQMILQNAKKQLEIIKTQASEEKAMLKFASERQKISSQFSTASFRMNNYNSAVSNGINTGTRVQESLQQSLTSNGSFANTALSLNNLQKQASGFTSNASNKDGLGGDIQKAKNFFGSLETLRKEGVQATDKEDLETKIKEIFQRGGTNLEESGIGSKIKTFISDGISAEQMSDPKMVAEAIDKFFSGISLDDLSFTSSIMAAAKATEAYTNAVTANYKNLLDASKISVDRKNAAIDNNTDAKRALADFGGSAFSPNQAFRAESQKLANIEGNLGIRSTEVRDANGIITGGKVSYDPIRDRLKGRSTTEKSNLVRDDLKKAYEARASGKLSTTDSAANDAKIGQLEAYQNSQVDTIKRQIEITKQSIAIEEQKNALNKKSLQDLANGDVMSFIKNQQVKFAQAAFESGDQRLIRSAGGQALAGASADYESRKAAGEGGLDSKITGTLAAAGVSRGLDPKIAAQLANNPEAERLKAQGRGLANELSAVSANQGAGGTDLFNSSVTTFDKAIKEFVSAFGPNRAVPNAGQGLPNVPNFQNAPNNPQAQVQGQAAVNNTKAPGQVAANQNQVATPMAPMPMIGEKDLANLNMFGSYVKELSAAVQKLSESKIQVSLAPTQHTVNITGSEVLSAIGPKVQEMVYTKIEEKFKNFKEELNRGRV